MRIPFLRPWLPDAGAWAPLLQRSYGESWFTNFGPLERLFAERCRELYAAPGYEAVPVANCTVGLTAALFAVEQPSAAAPAVILPSFTFPATLQAVLHAGWRPVLCDADPVTWEMSLPHLERLLRSERASAVMPVRSYGFVRDQSALLRLAREHRCHVIFDSAAAFGHPGRKGSIGSSEGEIEVFSLHATKTFAIGEGGLIFAPAAVAERIRAASNFALTPNRSFGDGGNMKLDELHAAVGLAMLDVIDGLVEERAALAERYRSLFDALPGAAQAPADVGPAPWQCFPVLFATTALRDRAAADLADASVATRPYYAPTVAAGYEGLKMPRFDTALTPVAESLSHRMLCLPIYPRMSAADRAYLLDAVRATIGRLAR